MRPAASPSLALVLVAAISVSDTALAQQGGLAPAGQTGIAAKFVIDIELLATAERALDSARKEGLEKTPGYVHRTRGRRLHTMLGDRPDLAVTIEGEDVRGDAPPKTIAIEGLRFSPGQVLLPKAGAVAFENKQTQPLSITDKAGAVLATIAPGETKQVQLATGDHVLSLKEFPFAKSVVKVLNRGATLALNEDTGEVPFTSLVEGDYKLSFWLGTELLHGPTPFVVPRGGQLFMRGTISANDVVTLEKPVDMRAQTLVAPPRPPPAPPPVTPDE